MIALWEDRLTWFLIGINTVLIAQMLAPALSDARKSALDPVSTETIEVRATAPGEMACTCTTAPLFAKPRLYRQTELLGETH